MIAGQEFVCPTCGPSERWDNGLCAIHSTEKEQVARDSYIDFISGRLFPFCTNGVYVFVSDTKRIAEHNDMVDCGILRLSESSTDYMMIYRVADEYMAFLVKKDEKTKIKLL